MSIPGMQSGPVAIDFGAFCVRVVQRRGRGAWVRACRDCPPRARGARPGAAEMIEAARIVLRRGRFRGRRVVTAMPIQDLVVKNFRLPNMPAAELESAVRYEAMDRIPGLDPDAEIRFSPAGVLPGRDDAHQEVIVFAARGAAVHEHLNMLDELGLECVGIDVPGLAPLRQFVSRLRRGRDAEKVTALADLGRTGMRFVIARGANLAFAKLFDVGGESLDGLVADRLSVSFEEAGRLRREVSAPRTNPPTGDAAPAADLVNEVNEAVRPGWDQIAKEIGLCLRYYAVTFRGRRPEEVVCVGGEAVDPWGLDYLSQVLGTPCRAGVASQGLNGSDAGLPGGEAMSADWATALGLAMKPGRRLIEVAA